MTVNPPAALTPLVSTAEIDKQLEELQARHPGVELKRSWRMWSVTFDAAKNPTGFVISKRWDMPPAAFVDGTPESAAAGEEFKKATITCADLDDLSEAEKQYIVFGWFYYYSAEEECLQVSNCMQVYQDKAANPLSATEEKALREAALTEVRKAAIVEDKRRAAGLPVIVRAKDLRRDMPELAIPSSIPDDATVGVIKKPVPPKGWKPKGWTKLKEQMFREWQAKGCPGVPFTDGKPLTEEMQRDIFNDGLEECLERERLVREAMRQAKGQA